MDVLRFSVFEFDRATSELRRNGRRVPLQDMPLRVLEMLLERPNELVLREAFFARLWPHDESGILDDNLNTAIRKLRLALNDSAHHPRFIETVPKRGYRFLAPVAREGEAPSASMVDTAPKDPAEGDISAPRSATRRRAFAAGAIAAVVLGALAFYFWGDPAKAPPADTVAVLPFVNASGDPADEYFSRGLTEELMDRLARAGGVRVVSRTSAFALQDQNLDASETGELLGAASLVEGSVRRDGDRLRISVRLVNASDGFQRWSETYDRRVRDAIAIQEDIAQAVANTLTGSSFAQAPSGDPEDIDPLAYDHYLKGRFNWHRRTEESLHAAVEHFSSSVQHAPNYAPAWAGLADAYAVLGFYDYLPPAESFPRAREAAQRALQLDPRNASAEATLGYAALYFDWDLEHAEERFRRSIALDPGSSKAHQWYGNLLTAAGRFDEAEREMRRAQQLEPLSLIASAALGWSLYHSGRYEQALEQCRLTLTLDSTFELAYLWGGWALERLGRYDEALTMLRAAARSGGAIAKASMARVHALRGERTEAKRIISELTSAGGYVPAYEISKAWFALGEREQADEWLQRAFDQRSHSLVFLRVDPQLEGHRREPAIQRLAARVSDSRPR